jgi:trans-aconitate methyltransferase
MPTTIPRFNDKNIDFYRNIKMDTFQHLAGVIGFDTSVDIDILFPIVKEASTLLELGAGYGRVIKALLHRGFKGKIIAVERVAELIDYLKQHIPELVVLQQQDIKHLQLNQEVEAITWLWSGILELSNEEQKETVKHLYTLLATNGVLILEIPRKVKYVGVHIGDQKIKVEAEWGTLDAYLPRHEEMIAYSQAAGFTSIQCIEYQTNTQLDRSLYILRK